MSDLDKWYGGTAHNELQLPMDYTFGFPPPSVRPSKAEGLPIDYFRTQLMSVERRFKVLNRCCFSTTTTRYAQWIASETDSTTRISPKCWRHYS